MNWISQDVTVNSSTWTPVAAPFDCDVLTVRNTAGASLRYSPGQGATEDQLEPGAQFSIAMHRHTQRWIHGGPRFKEGEPAVYLKLAAGTAAIKVTFLR
ncbi:MAG: hypothetical protein FJW20_17650 [Acidimicrobiia bacterium]|nr:hypothetical protein [Acidimicrobiia bacterium]